MSKTTRAKKPNFKTVDLAAPVWEPKVGEMCEYLYEHEHKDDEWVKCYVISKGAMMARIGFENPTTTPKRITETDTVIGTNLREGQAPASKLDQL